MGQIFNRIKNIISSEVNSEKFDSTLPNSDDDLLKKIIDDLNDSTSKGNHAPNDEKRNSNQNSENNNSKSKNFQNQTHDEKSSIGSIEEAFSILEINDSASYEEIRNAYIQKIKEYHPDKVQHLGKDIRLLAEQKTLKINQAYEFIKEIRHF